MLKPPKKTGDPQVARFFYIRNFQYNQ